MTILNQNIVKIQNFVIQILTVLLTIIKTINIITIKTEDFYKDIADDVEK